MVHVKKAVPLVQPHRRSMDYLRRVYGMMTLHALLGSARQHGLRQAGMTATLSPRP